MLSAPELRDTTRLSQRYPPIARYGVFGVSTWPVGESMRSGGAIPPPQKGYLSDTGAIPHENKAKWVRYPPLRYYLEKVLRDMGGVISHWAAKRLCKI